MEHKGTPVVTDMQVIPVAGYDSMLMTLSGAHAPWFTRNLVILRDSSGHTGIGEIHGGGYTCEALNSCLPWEDTGISWIPSTRTVHGRQRMMGRVSRHWISAS